MHGHDILDTLTDPDFWKKIGGFLVAGFISVHNVERQNGEEGKQPMTFRAKFTIWIISMGVGWLCYEWAISFGADSFSFLIGATAASFGMTVLDAFRKLLPDQIKKWINK